jgi:Zn-dependent protease with chaperone function/tetratricopeptide (TPR) repeat protein
LFVGELLKALLDLSEWVPTMVGFAVFWSLLWILYAVAARQQQRESGGTLLQLAFVATILATAALAPGFVISLMGTGRVYIDASIQLAFVHALTLLRFPVRLRPYGQETQPVDSPELLETCDELAGELGIRTPVVRQLHLDITNGWTYGMVRPAVVLTDGALHRLEPDERDAVIAHEFAHIAYRTIWLFLAIQVLAACAAAWALRLPGPLSFLLGLAVWTGASRVASRWHEWLCDLRAAELVGFGSAVRGLGKVYALRQVANTGWLALLFDAVSSHPPRDLRLAQLAAAAPAHDRLEPPVPPEAIRPHRIAARVATCVWAASIVLGCCFATRYPLAVSIVWLAVVVVPWLLFFQVTASTRQLNARRLNNGKRQLGLGFLLLCALALYVATTVQTGRLLDFETFGVGLSVLFLFIFLVYFLASMGTNDVRHRIVAAVNARKYREALDMAAQQPRKVAKDVTTQHNLAVARLGLGELEQAVVELTTLWQNKRFGYSGLCLAELALDDNRIEEALLLVGELSQVWPKDPAPPLLRGRALRRAGRLDEADEALGAIPPEGDARGSALALRAGVALDRGDLDAARNLIAEALQVAPGAAYGLIVAAEIAQRDDSGEAGAAVEKALRALEMTPIHFLHFEIARLQTVSTR